MTRPALASAVAALRTRDPRFPWVGPTDEEDDIAAVLEVIDDTHQPASDQPDQHGRYGSCSGCGEQWPCSEWVRGEHLAVRWLGLAAYRVLAHAHAAVEAARAAS